MENSSLDGARVNRSNQKIKKILIWNVGMYKIRRNKKNESFFLFLMVNKAGRE